MIRLFLGIIVVIAISLGMAYMQSIQVKTQEAIDNAVIPETGKLINTQAQKFFQTTSKDDYFVVDVRTTEEYEKAHSAGIKNIPLATFETDKEACKTVISQLPKYKKIVFMCPFGPRAEEMYYNLVDSTEDGGCGFNKKDVYFVKAKVKFLPNEVTID